MGEVEYELEHPKASKKGRHRKKLLYNSILQLMEFYFSDSNLAKDRFLSQLINENPCTYLLDKTDFEFFLFSTLNVSAIKIQSDVDLNIFLKFNKIRKLNCALDDIRKAISKSNLIELSDDKEKIKRKVPIKVNTNVDNCTIYVENIKADANHEWVSHIFSEFGNVVYVSIPKYRHNKTNKGFAFVEFEDEEASKVALDYFESIGCKMPSETSPENLKSIQTFEEKGVGSSDKMETNLEIETKEPIKNDDKHLTQTKVKTFETNETKKRKLDEDAAVEESNKKLKVDTADLDVKKNQNENVDGEDSEHKKKKKHKKDKKKNVIKELGLQVLSKPEWKKMRNRYLDLQKKKMKEFKQYLNRQKFSNKNFERPKKSSNESSQDEQPKEEQSTKLDFIPGVIVKVKFAEPVIDAKKIKSEIKALSSDIKYVDIPSPVGNEEIFVRFSNSKGAKEFCKKEAFGEKTLLEAAEENIYWEKIQNDRGIKFSKNAKKQRGRDKLLKKAEKERAKHLRFDEGD